MNRQRAIEKAEDMIRYPSKYTPDLVFVQANNGQLMVHPKSRLMECIHYIRNRRHWTAQSLLGHFRNTSLSKPSLAKVEGVEITASVCFFKRTKESFREAGIMVNYDQQIVDALGQPVKDVYDYQVASDLGCFHYRS